MDNAYTYTLILVLSMAGPLALSFDRKVAFFKKWKPLFTAMILPAVFYTIWDIIFTYLGVWSFSDKHITGVHLVNLPIEEVLFFWIVPYCCMFIYACIEAYFPAMKSGDIHRMILKVLGWILLIISVCFYDRLYTFWTFSMNAVFLIFLLPKQFHSARFLLSYSITLIPFLVVNGFLTAIPVVIYNNAENLGIRLTTIPIEDIFYGMLLVMLNIVLFERLTKKCEN